MISQEDRLRIYDAVQSATGGPGLAELVCSFAEGAGSDGALPAVLAHTKRPGRRRIPPPPPPGPFPKATASLLGLHNPGVGSAPLA